MMAEKEAGAYDNAHFPMIWTPFKAPSGVMTCVFSPGAMNSLLSTGGLTISMQISKRCHGEI